MKPYPIMLLIIASTSAVAADTGGDFWKNCPGPACPADSPYTTEKMERDSTSENVKNSSDRKFDRGDGNREKRKEEAIKPEKTDRKDVAP